MFKTCYLGLFTFKSHILKLNGSILSLVVGFFGGSPTQIGVCFASSKLSLKYRVSTSLLMCGSRGRHLVISSSYHTCILFIFNPFFYNITYLSWLATSYNYPSFTVSMWSYHWWFRYPFVLVPLWKWVYNIPQHISRYCCSYCFGEWSTCS